MYNSGAIKDINFFFFPLFFLFSSLLMTRWIFGMASKYILFFFIIPGVYTHCMISILLFSLDILAGLDEKFKRFLEPVVSRTL